MRFSPYPWLASLAFVLLAVGFFLPRRDRVLHAWLMSTGIAIDVALVLILEFSKDAVATVFGHTLTGWQYAHVGCSTAAVLFYAPVFILGLKRLRDPRCSPKIALWHVRLGFCAFGCRALGFAFMFSMLDR